MAGMKRKAYGRRWMAVTAFLAALLLIPLARPFHFGRKTTRSAAMDAAAQVRPKESQISGQNEIDIKSNYATINWKKPGPVPEKLNDPFDLNRRLDNPMNARMRAEADMQTESFETTESGPDFRISGIVYSEEQPLTIINGQLLHKGDSYSGFVITDIQRDVVEFMRNDRRWSRNMRKEDE